VATLHVRNVPEPLYELLRDCAEREGRSIGAQAIVFIQQGVMPHAARRVLPRRLSGVQRFTGGAREVVVRAQDEARSLGAPEVLPGHLIIGLLLVDGPAQDALAELGVSPTEVRDRLPQGEGSPKRIPFGGVSKQALERALRESLALRHDYIGSEHLLLALADDPLLASLDVQAAVAATLGRPVETMPTEPEAPYLVVELDGTPESWTEQLNELAADGWELLQLVERRAILRR
jgi:hypothetical protein